MSTYLPPLIPTLHDLLTHGRGQPSSPALWLPPSACIQYAPDGSMQRGQIITYAQLQGAINQLKRLLFNEHHANWPLVYPQCCAASAAPFTFLPIPTTPASSPNPAPLSSSSLSVPTPSRSSGTIAFSLRNGVEFITAFLATTAGGAIAAPLNPDYTKEEVKVGKAMIASTSQ